MKTTRWLIVLGHIIAFGVAIAASSTNDLDRGLEIAKASDTNFSGYGDSKTTLKNLRRQKTLLKQPLNLRKQGKETTSTAFGVALQ